LPLPELEVGKEAASIVLRYGKVQPIPAVMNGSGTGFWATAEEACYFIDGIGAFLIRKGYEVIIDPVPGVKNGILRLPIVGSVLTLLLHQRGRLVLHASAIEAGEHAVAFVGGTGWGKSTQVAILERRGYQIVADDTTAIDVSESSCLVLPGVPWLRLWPDTVVSLGGTPEDMSRLHPLLEKRARPTRESPQKSLPLRCIYLLGLGSAPVIEPCAPREALTELMRHWKGAKFGPELLRASNISSFFSQCAALAKNIPIYRLKRPASLAALPEVTDLVEDHLSLGM
jgi:hypothetical protein